MNQDSPAAFQCVIKATMARTSLSLNFPVSPSNCQISITKAATETSSHYTNLTVLQVPELNHWSRGLCIMCLEQWLPTMPNQTILRFPKPKTKRCWRHCECEQMHCGVLVIAWFSAAFSHVHIYTVQYLKKAYRNIWPWMAVRVIVQG